MRTYHLAAALAALLLYLPSAALAHHSRDVYFNMDAVIELTNVTAVSFKVVNPHSQLIFVSEDDQGNEVEWTAGVMSASHLRRAGVTPDLIRPGDMLTVTGAPSLDDSNVMWLYTVVLPNGDVADLFDAIRTGTDVISPAGAR
ncbi:MAG: DUF6152 family protein [bacterium]|nr:DUF6152 family protein [bacterium]